MKYYSFTFIGFFIHTTYKMGGGMLGAGVHKVSCEKKPISLSFYIGSIHFSNTKKQKEDFQ